MYDEFYELSGDPFRLSPGDQPCFSHAGYARARAHLEYALHKREGIALLTGGPGLGKTSLIGELEHQLQNSRVSVTRLTCSQWSSKDLLCAITEGYGLTIGKRNKAFLLEGIESILADVLLREQRQSILILDEAQALPVETLEQVRLLSNLNWKNSPLIQIMLVGQSALRDTVLLPEFEQLHQRVIVSATLAPLNEHEVTEYILHRLHHAGWVQNPNLADGIFPLVHRYSEGIPRWINLICSRLLLNGMAEQSTRLTTRNLNQVIDELISEDLLPEGVRHAA